MVKLLIVDDEIQIRTGIRDSINWKELGIQVCGLAGCVSDALDMIELQAPDIIIIDICMPQISGLELLEITHDQYPNIRVILISGYRGAFPVTSVNRRASAPYLSMTSRGSIPLPRLLLIFLP